MKKSLPFPFTRFQYVPEMHNSYNMSIFLEANFLELACSLTHSLPRSLHLFRSLIYWQLKESLKSNTYIRFFEVLVSLCLFGLFNNSHTLRKSKWTIYIGFKYHGASNGVSH